MKPPVLLQKIFALGLAVFSFLTSFSQSATCDTTMINARLNPAGFTRLYVPTEPCSMYFYNPTPMYGITAHLDAINLGVPQLIINSAQENTDVNAALHAQGVFPTNDEVWMGITDSAVTYTWRTFTGGVAPAYTNWASGEPNNTSPTCKVLGSCAFCSGNDVYWCHNGEDCAVMNDGGQWLNITCEGNNVTHIAVLELNVCPVVTPIHDTTICSGNAVNASFAVDSGGTAPYTYTWNPGNLSGPGVTLSPANTDTVTVKVSDLFLCGATDTFIITVNPSPVADAGLDLQLCAGATDTLGIAPDSNYVYSWSLAWGLSSTVISDPVITLSGGRGSATIDTTYILTATYGNCVSHDTVNVTLYPYVNNNFTTASTGICANEGLLVTYLGTSSPTATYNWDFDSATIISGSGAGNYVLSWPTARTAYISLNTIDHGCSDTPGIQTVTVYALPNPTIVSTGRDSLATQNYTTYQWLLNGQAITGADSQAYVASANGDYRVIAVDSAGCADTSAVYAVTGVGIANINDPRFQINIYPNPNNGSFIIETDKAIGGKITISDVLGRVILSQSITANRQAIDINGQLISGEYTVSIETDGSIYARKMIVEKE